MKFMLFSFLFALLFVSCSTDKIVEQSNQSNFMNHSQIVDGINQPILNDEKIDLTDEYKLRRSNLIPDDEFIKGMEKKTELLHKKRRSQKAGELIDSDLRNRDTKVKTQDGPLCTAWATVASMENTLNKQQPSDWDLSEMHLWSKYKLYSTEDAILASAKYKIADEIEYPTYGSKKSTADKNAKYKVDSYKYLGDSPDNAMLALSQGHPVVIAMKTPNDLLDCRATVRTTTTASNGGHAISIVGFKKDSSIKGGGYFIFKNSWGSDCGDKGYQYVPLHAICAKSSFYCYFWSINTVSINGVVPTPTDPIPTPIPEPTPVEPKKEQVCVEWKRVWYAPWKYKCVDWEWVEVK